MAMEAMIYCVFYVIKFYPSSSSFMLIFLLLIFHMKISVSKSTNYYIQKNEWEWFWKILFMLIFISSKFTNESPVSKRTKSHVAVIFFLHLSPINIVTSSLFDGQRLLQILAWIILVDIGVSSFYSSYSHLAQKVM